MTLNQKQIEELQVAAKPLFEFLVKNCHPHCMIIVDSQRAELVEGIAAVLSKP